MLPCTRGCRMGLKEYSSSSVFVKLIHRHQKSAALAAPSRVPLRLAAPCVAAALQTVSLLRRSSGGVAAASTPAFTFTTTRAPFHVSAHSCWHSSAAAAAAPRPMAQMRAYATWPARIDRASVTGDEAEALRSAAALVPALTAAAHKGQHGKVGVLGGCREYAGAPYFAALSAVKVGADLAHVICTPGAAPVIKGYSPELIVLPFLPDDTDHHHHQQQQQPEDADERRLAAIRGWLAKLSVLVVGPGLGDDPRVVALSRRVVKEARDMGLPLLIDGSGLNFVAADVALVRGYDRCVLTPNLPELGRLAAGAGVALDGAIGAHWQAGGAPALARALAGPVIVSKGPQDWIAAPGKAGALVCGLGSSPRRAGGQGDVVAGAIAAFMCWAYPRHNNGGGSSSGGGGEMQGGGGEGTPHTHSALMRAAYGGCAVVRAAATRAFAAHRRSMLATDVIAALPAAFEDLFEERGDAGSGGEGGGVRSTL